MTRRGPRTNREILWSTWSESDLARLFEDLLDTHGWRWHHETDSRRSKAGLPDYICWKFRQFMMVELKRERGWVSPAQRITMLTLAQADIEVHLWYPHDEDEIRARLAVVVPVDPLLSRIPR